MRRNAGAGGACAVERTPLPLVWDRHAVVRLWTTLIAGQDVNLPRRGYEQSEPVPDRLIRLSRRHSSRSPPPPPSVPTNAGLSRGISVTDLATATRRIRGFCGEGPGALALLVVTRWLHIDRFSARRANRSPDRSLVMVVH